MAIFEENYLGGRHYPIEYRTFNQTKKLVIYSKNKPKIIEVTVNEETETKYSRQIQITTKGGKKMWVNKKDLF